MSEINDEIRSAPSKTPAKSERAGRTPSFLIRVLCLTISGSLLLGDPSWAAGLSDFFSASFSGDLASLSVPSKFGTITDQWTSPERSSTVVLIQDLHANIGVQKNVAMIVEILYRRYHISRVFTEAAFGPCEVSLLRTVPSRRGQLKLIDRLLSQALINGVEIAAARAGSGRLSPIKLEGVDDPLLYLANVQAFRDLVKAGPDAAYEWKSLRDLLMPGAAPQLRKHLELTEKLLSLKLIDSEWLEYQDHRDLTPQGSPRFNAAIAAAERFYIAAQARNGALAQNLMASMASNFGQARGPAPTAVLFTGGFHTATIAHMLKTRGISFIVVTPQVDRLDQDEIYLQSMTEPPHETVAAFLSSNFLGSRVLGRIVILGDLISGPWAKMRGVGAIQVEETFTGQHADKLTAWEWAWSSLRKWTLRLATAGFTFAVLTAQTVKAATFDPIANTFTPGTGQGLLSIGKQFMNKFHHEFPMKQVLNINHIQNPNIIQKITYQLPDSMAHAQSAHQIALPPPGPATAPPLSIQPVHDFWTALLRVGQSVQQFLGQQEVVLIIAAGFLAGAYLVYRYRAPLRTALSKTSQSLRAHRKILITFGDAKRARLAFVETEAEFQTSWAQITDSAKIYETRKTAQEALRNMETVLRRGELKAGYRNRGSFAVLYDQIRNASIEPFGSGFRIIAGNAAPGISPTLSKEESRAPPALTWSWAHSQIIQATVGLLFIISGIFFLASSSNALTIELHPHASGIYSVGALLPILLGIGIIAAA